jgi:hypothetical protein
MSPTQVRLTVFILLLALATTLSAQPKPRARDLGVPFDGTPGTNNAITDVKGVEVGHTTLISGEGKLEIGKVRFEPASRPFILGEKPATTPFSPHGSPSTATAK